MLSSRDTDSTIPVTDCHCLKCRFPLIPVFDKSTTQPNPETENEE